MKYILFAVCFLAFSSLGYSQESRADAFDFYRAGQCDKAIPIFEQALVADKKDYAARLYLGGCYVKTGKEQEARKVLGYLKASKSAPGSGVDTTAKANRNVHARYTDEARSRGIQGTIKLVVEVKANGQTGFIFVVNELPYGLTDNAVRAASETIWQPAVKEGKAVDSILTREFSFSIY